MGQKGKHMQGRRISDKLTQCGDRLMISPGLIRDDGSGLAREGHEGRVHLNCGTWTGVTRQLQGGRQWVRCIG